MIRDRSPVPSRAEGTVARPRTPLERWADRSPAVAAAFVAVLCFGTSELGLSLAQVHGSVMALCPAVGISLAAVLVGGSWMLPGVAVGALAANLTTPAPLSADVGMALGSTVGPFVAAIILRRNQFRASLQRIHDVVALVLLGALVPSAISATIGVASLLASSGLPGSEGPSTWRVWLL